MKHFIVKLLTVAVFTALWTACGYNGGDKHVSEAPDTTATAIDSLALPNDSLAPNSAVDSTATATDTLPQIIISGDSVPYVHSSSFIVVSKKDLRLIVYARSNRGDTIALARPGNTTSVTGVAISCPTGTGSCASTLQGIAASASTAAPTTRTPFPDVPARAASACLIRTSSPSRSVTPAWACLSSSRPRSKACSPSSRNAFHPAPA